MVHKQCCWKYRLHKLGESWKWNLFFRRITDYMYERYRGPRGPLFSLHDRLSPVVSLAANFDSLLVPKDHVSRKKSDSYYINSQHMLRFSTLSKIVVSKLKSRSGAVYILRSQKIRIFDPYPPSCSHLVHTWDIPPENYVCRPLPPPICKKRAISKKE